MRMIMSEDCDRGFLSRRHDKYNNSYIYLVVIDKKLLNVNCIKITKNKYML